MRRQTDVNLPERFNFILILNSAEKRNVIYFIRGERDRRFHCGFDCVTCGRTYSLMGQAMHSFPKVSR